MNKKEDNFIDKLTSLCKQRGFIYPGSEIYGGLGGVYDYGHYGLLLKDNIRNEWLKSMIQYRDDVYGLDSAIFMHPTAWVASGHVGNFDDPQIECRNCNNRMRADHLLEDFGIDADKASIEFVNEQLDKLRLEKKLVCTKCGSADLGQAIKFSLMVKSNFGSPTDAMTEENVVYLRPETCGGIYLQYKNTVDSLHPKLPFGIAQVGKAFRNEIAARQYVFRTREFEQMEMQYFLKPETMKEYYEMWKNIRWNWYRDLGIPEEKLRWHKHEKLAHYASEAYDIEYNYKCLGGFKELEGIHARGNWDLSQHAKFSGVDLSYFDEETKSRFVPHIMETSAGLARNMLMFLDNAYTEDELGGEKRVYLKLPAKLAPIKVAILPLLKNKPALIEKAKKIYNDIRKRFTSEYDESGSVGKRYRRQDEIGTPFCVTVDFDTLGENPALLNTVTIRDRDTGKQERIAIDQLIAYVEGKM